MALSFKFQTSFHLSFYSTLPPFSLVSDPYWKEPGRAFGLDSGY